MFANYNAATNNIGGIAGNIIGAGLGSLVLPGLGGILGGLAGRGLGSLADNGLGALFRGINLLGQRQFSSPPTGQSSGGPNLSALASLFAPSGTPAATTVPVLKGAGGFGGGGVGGFASGNGDLGGSMGYSQGVFGGYGGGSPLQRAQALREERLS